VPYKMVVLDLDDTLLRDDLTISERTSDSLLKAQKQGVIMVLASGRPTGPVRRYAEELELARHGGWILSFNGAVITECATGAVIFEQSLSAELVHEIHDRAVSLGANILSYVDDKIVTPRADEWTAVERRLTGMEVVEVADFKGAIRGPAVKAIVLHEPARLREISDKIRPEIEGRLSMAISKPFFLEFTDNGIDKRHSLSRLCAHLGIDSSEVVAIGDGQNDAGMIQLAGLGISMANGAAEVRAIADHVTASNMDDGVAQAVERFVLAKA
jgi:Cof subfamily protein (haloacid dehalogenase superfamily)